VETRLFTNPDRVDHGMPIPKSITYFNKRITNRLFIPFAGWIPPLAIIEHYGRKSGSQYKTPILAFPTRDGFVFALTYGRNVDWVKNLQASGYGVLKYNRSTYQINNFRFSTYMDLKEIFPGVVRLFLETLQVTDCFMVEKQDKTLREYSGSENKTFIHHLTWCMPKVNLG
jgi:deazaflavin-dependent oxidoreductase (nitroreductase family)